MKKVLIGLSIICFLFISCASTSIFPGEEELIETKDINYTVENKTNLTEKELREDCDLLKYIVYNIYAGIDEAISLGFDLDATIEDIYNQTLKKKNPANGMYPVSDFSAIIRSTMSKNIPNNDQHSQIAGNLKDSISVFYSNIYFEKKDDKYFVCKSDSENVKIGDEYTGPETNLYKFYSENGDIYRYGIMTKQNIKSSFVFVNNEKISVPTEREKTIPTKSYWTSIKSTDKTLYISLGDCMQAYGKGDTADRFSSVWNKFLANISEQAKGKENIIFDLRSNPGGYMEYPAKILTAAYYYNHADDEAFIKDINALFWNKACEDNTFLSSPITMASYKELYQNDLKNEFENLKPEYQQYFKTYWRQANLKPIRKHIPLDYKACSFESFPKPDFTGNVYLLLNSDSASAAEFGTQMAYLLSDQGIKVTIVGENSWGGQKYGGMNGYKLKHSGIFIYLGFYFGESPNLKSIQNWKGEGMGYLPDYWATNDIILPTLINLIKDEQLAETLKGLDKGQL